MPSAEKQARIAENKRQQGINEGFGQVNAIFGQGREAQYGDYLQALRDRGNADLNDQQTIVDRASKFNLARRGVIGGSSEMDTQRRNRKRYIQALIGNESRANAAVGQLRGRDDQTRRGLLDMIFGGMDASTAAQRAQMGQHANVQAAQADFIPYALDSIGEAAADAYGYGARKDAYSEGGERARQDLYG